MQKKGIKYANLYCVDNCLAKMGDPEFLGYNISQGSDCGAKVVAKKTPEESVGVICIRDGRFEVVEYTEMSEKHNNLMDNGKLAFRMANICNHFYTTKFLASLKDCSDKLKLHVARKKIPCMQGDVIIKPDKPNGVKLEAFVFDVFPFAPKFKVFEVDRSVEFSPLKNAPGSSSDSPESSRNDLEKLHRDFITKAGAKVGQGVGFELSPLITYNGEGLEFIKDKNLEPKYYSSIDALKKV